MPVRFNECIIVQKRIKIRSSDDAEVLRIKNI